MRPDLEIKLRRYVGLLEKWQAQINLVSRSTLSDVWGRHIEDSLQLVSLLRPDERVLVDVGSGGGLPGVVLAMACPEIAVTLVESDRRKAVFLSTVSRETSVPFRVCRERVEALDLPAPDVITARAFAPLESLLDLTSGIRGAETRLLLLKGEQWEAEVELAKKAWKFEWQSYTSKTNPKGVMLALEHVERR